MLVFLICPFTAICIVFAVLGYGAINDGKRLLFTGILLFALAWVAVLGLVLAFSYAKGEDHGASKAISDFKYPAHASESADRFVGGTHKWHRLMFVVLLSSGCAQLLAIWCKRRTRTALLSNLGRSATCANIDSSDR